MHSHCALSDPLRPSLFEILVRMAFRVKANCAKVSVGLSFLAIAPSGEMRDESGSRQGVRCVGLGWAHECVMVMVCRIVSARRRYGSHYSG